MGPITLFDKSFLESLNIDESVWFDNFFYPVICPLFFVETLADLQKEKSDRAPEDRVRQIAEKTPEMHGGMCALHNNLCIAELLGHPIPMTGQIPRAQGRMVSSGGKRGVVYEPSPEEEALNRWEQGEFHLVERRFAQSWREGLATLNLNAVAEAMRAIGVDSKSCKTLEQAKTWAVEVVQGQKNHFERMRLVFEFVGVPLKLRSKILERWSLTKYRPLPSYAPYTAHVLTVELFFQAALGGHLIAANRPSNRVDVAYLFYLPFSMVFVSTDRLHRRCAEQFLRNDQSFVWGADLKADLGRIDAHYKTLPDEVKQQGVMRFAQVPPEEVSTLTRDLWSKHLASHALRERPSLPAQDSKASRRLIEHMTQLASAAPISAAEAARLSNVDFDQMIVKRNIKRRKGSWLQVPLGLSKASDSQ